MAVALTAVVTGLTAVSGCGFTITKQEVPELLEPVIVTLKGEKAVRGNIQDIEVFKGSIKEESISYAFPGNCYVENLAVHVGQYIEKGDLIARVNTEEFEKELADLKTEILYLENCNEIETELSAILLQNSQIDIQMMSPKSEWYQEAQTQLELQRKQSDFEKTERELQIEQKKVELATLYEKNGAEDIYASESGYLIYAKDFSVNNPTGYINANEIIAVTAMDSGYYIASSMPLVTAREADFIYAVINGKQYDLTYEPYDEKELKRASKEGLTLESRFLCKEDLSTLKGSEVTVYAVTNYRENVISISPDAFFTENNTDFVYLIQDGKKVKQEVEDGVHTQNAVEIKEGLQEGDEVYCQTVDIPGSNQKLITIKEDHFQLTRRYDTAKIAYPDVYPVVNKIADARVKEICVSNGQKVKAGDAILILEASESSSKVLDNNVEITGLTRNYEYEMALYQQKLEDKQKQAKEMGENETAYTAAGKKLNLEIAAIQLSMQKEKVTYEYKKELLQRDSEYNQKESGVVTITAKRDGVVRELASLSEGFSLEEDTLICKIADPDFTCIKLFTDGEIVPVGSSVMIQSGAGAQEVRGCVVSSYPDLLGTIYDDNCYLKETSSQSKDAVYIVLEDENTYENLGMFGVNVTVWDVENAIVVNSKCVYSQGDSKTGKRYVWVEENGSFSKRYVTVGYLDSDIAWIVQGLWAGERIVEEG